MRAFLPAVVLLVAGTAAAQDATPSTGLADSLVQEAAEVSRRTTPALVSVTATTEGRTPAQTVFAGLVVAPPPRDPEHLEATGFLVEPGVVATTISVSRPSARYEIRFAGGVTKSAALLGSDEVYGLALLRVDAPEGTLPITEAAPALAPGARSAAWLAVPCSKGIAEPQVAIVRGAKCSESAYDRPLCASICLQPGAAGAPLVAADGKLVGMAVGAADGGAASPPSAARHCRTTLFVRGEDVLAAAREILRTGRVRHARLGVLLDADSNRVDQVIPGGPAELAGIREGDAFLSVAGVPVESAVDITRALLRRRPGESVPVETSRGGAAVASRVTLDEVSLPPPPTSAPVPGTVLRWSWRDDPGPADASAAMLPFVTVHEVVAGSSAESAGVQAGDEVVSIDGTDVLRYLARHRVRPTAAPPAAIVVRRAEAEVRIEIRAR